MSDTPEQQPGALDSAFLVKQPTSKSGALSVAGAIPLGAAQTSEMLQNMQQMVNQRAGVNPDELVFSGGPKYNTIMNSLKDVAAWSSGGVKGPSEALALRDAEKAKEAKELFEMRTQMAAYKAAQEQAKANSEKWKSLNAAGGAGGIGGIGGDAAGSFSIPAEQLQRERFAQNDTERIALRQDFLKTLAKENMSPELDKPQDYMMPGAGPVRMTPRALRALPPAVQKQIEMETLKQFGVLPAASATAAPVAPVGGSQYTSAAKPAQATDMSSVSEIPTMRKIAGAESNFKNVPNAEGVSSAFGLYQITSAKFKDIQAKHPEFKDVTYEQFKTNPSIQTAFADAGYKDQAELFKKENIENNDTNHYATWFSGNTKLAKAGAGEPIENALTKEQIAANPWVAGKKVGAVRTELTRRLETNAGTSVQPAAATPAAAAPATSTQPINVQGLPPQPDPRAFGSNYEGYKNALEAWKTQVAEIQKGTGTTSKETAQQDVDKRNEYRKSLSTTQKTYDEYSNLLKNSAGKADVFNISGQGILGPIGAKVTPQSPNESTNEALNRTWQSTEKQGHFKTIQQGSAEAQAAWAKNLVEGAGGRLTNADLNLGAIAKGVGVDQTYQSHMKNLAKNMQDIRTAYYRANAFDDWEAKNPGKPVSEFEKSDYYKNGAKIDAARDVADKFKGVPEADYVKIDPETKREYVIINGRGVYLKK